MSRQVDILEKLTGLFKQATEEHSHFYVAKVVSEAILEIERLREIEWMYRELCK